MAHKKTPFRSVAREEMLRGATQLADALRVMPGPRSNLVPVERKWDAALASDEGRTRPCNALRALPTKQSE
jgi:chaperonin GroEL